MTGRERDGPPQGDPDEHEEPRGDRIDPRMQPHGDRQERRPRRDGAADDAPHDDAAGDHDGMVGRDGTPMGEDLLRDGAVGG